MRLPPLIGKTVAERRREARENKMERRCEAEAVEAEARFVKAGISLSLL